MELLTEIIKSIPPGSCSYSEWTQVGMALKHEGYPVDDWASWSAKDSDRYHPGECERKWSSFREEAGNIVTAGTIVELARRFGWHSKYDGEGRALAWDDEISDEPPVDPRFLDTAEVPHVRKWDPNEQIITYLSTLFNSDDYVGYVVKSMEKKEEGKPVKYVPADRGKYQRTAGELIADLQKTDDIGAVFGDYRPEAGAWVRFNPLDGKGVANVNVADYKYALVESDTEVIGKQLSIIKELRLPVALMVHSGGKSIHAIVKIGAADAKEYRDRVNYLYGVCGKNGLVIDTQNCNPSRLSRLPGIMRNGNKQYIIPDSINTGEKSFEEWKDYYEGINDDLPDVETAEAWFSNPPELAPVLIDGILRQGDKLLVSGPSKAGKSFAMLELAAAIAEGKDWMGIKCAQGRVLYVNLELHDASCKHRIIDVYKALGWQPTALHNLDTWGLRGKAIPMDRLTPRLIRRAKDRNYMAIIIDPIYKVITGDENSADQMAAFCNNFDKVCTTLSASVIYCHHFSKSASEVSNNSSAMNKASGSGVFARDPDAMLSFTQAKVKNQPVEDKRTAWIVEGALREFEPLEPVKVWFDYPIHTRMDASDAEDTTLYKDAPKDERSATQKTEEAFYILREDESKGVALLDLADYRGVSDRQIRKQIKDIRCLEIENNVVFEKGKKRNSEH